MVIFLNLHPEERASARVSKDDFSESPLVLRDAAFGGSSG
jgi:hypothetical protein